MADIGVVLTPEGKENLEKELKYLETTRRAEVAERIGTAREFGDISENSEYDDAKNEQAQLEARILEINRILSDATVVVASKRSGKVNIGSVVHVEMNGEKRTFTIVGAAESDVRVGKISNESAVGAALLGHKKGDEFKIAGPTGRKVSILIEKIEN